MTTVTYGNYTFGPLLSDVLDEARYVHARVSNYGHLGQTTTQQNQRVADIVNRAVRDFLDACPKLGRTTSTISIVSGTQSYAIPASMEGWALQKLYFTESNSSYDGKFIEYVDDSRWNSLEPWRRNGLVTSEYPQYWTFNLARTHIMFAPMPNASKTVTAIWKVAPTDVTYALIATPGVTEINEIPTKFQEAIAVRVAADIVRPILPERYIELSQRAMALYDAAINEICQPDSALDGISAPQWDNNLWIPEIPYFNVRGGSVE